MSTIQDKLNEELARIQYNKASPLTNNQVSLIFDTMSKIDPDLKPLIVILENLIKNLDDDRVKTLYTLQFLKFYGIGNNDILTMRQKYIIESGSLVKIPFIKSRHKESINILMDSIGLKDIINGK